jgi:hypothetical protein
MNNTTRKLFIILLSNKTLHKVKTLFFWTLMIIIFVSCHSQQEQAHGDTKQKVIVSEPTESTSGSIEGIFGGCGYNYTPEQSSITLHYPRTRELNQINSILKFSGLSSNFRIYSAEINNAVATIIDYKRYIIYDPRLLSYTDDRSGGYWSSMSILAHEIGHHLSGHTITNKGSNPTDELEADKYSGFILYKLGATLQQASAAMQSLGSEHGSVTHPAKSDRLGAITKGWGEANQTRYNGAIPPPPNDNSVSFDEYTVNMLISKENLQHEDASIWYGEYQFINGIVTEVAKDLSNVTIHMVQTGSKFARDFRSVDGEDWIIYIDQKSWSEDNEMSHVASMNFPALLVPGRRLKFSMVEGYPGCGTAMNGVWFLTYAKAMDGSSF